MPRAKSHLGIYFSVFGMAFSFLLSVLGMTTGWRFVIWMVVCGLFLFPVWHSDWKRLTIWLRVGTSVLIISAIGLWAWQTWPQPVTVSPTRIKVSGSGWTRVDFITVTNHEN